MEAAGVRRKTCGLISPRMATITGALDALVHLLTIEFDHFQ